MLAQNKIICGILICYLNAGVFIIALSQESRSFELDGFIEFDHISYFEEKPDQVINSRNQGLFQLDLSFEFAEKASVFLSTEFREDLNLRQNEELGKLQRSLLKEVQDFAEAEGYDLVVGDGVLFASTSVNITDEVLQAVEANFQATGAR